MPYQPDKTPRAAPPINARGTTVLRAPLSDNHQANLQWQALLDAGLIGTAPPEPSPEIVARRAANDALFRRIAADRRIAARTPTATALHTSGDFA